MRLWMAQGMTMAMRFVDGAPPALVPTHPSSNSSSDDMDNATAIDTENGSGTRVLF